MTFEFVTGGGESLPLQANSHSRAGAFIRDSCGEHRHWRACHDQSGCQEPPACYGELHCRTAIYSSSILWTPFQWAPRIKHVIEESMQIPVSLSSGHITALSGILLLCEKPLGVTQGTSDVCVGGATNVCSGSISRFFISSLPFMRQVIVDPTDYNTLLDALKSGKDDLDFRKRLAWKAYQHTATYDSTVAEWMWSQIGALPILWLVCHLPGSREAWWTFYPSNRCCPARTPYLLCWRISICVPVPSTL